MSKGFLLDANVLIALGWIEHTSHQVVQNYLQTIDIWATCSITQLAFIRISSTTGIFSQSVRPFQAQSVLGQLCEDSSHQYLVDHLSALDCDFTQLTGHRQTTDAYLVALAEYYDFTLLTLDKRLVNTFPDRNIQLLH